MHWLCALKLLSLGSEVKLIKNILIIYLCVCVGGMTAGSLEVRSVGFPGAGVATN